MRSQAIDVAKGIGIFSVVLGHSYFFRVNASEFYKALYLFHMPLFFVLSGAVITRPFNRETIFRRFISLSKPYVMGVLCTLPFQIAKPSHPSNDSPWMGFLWGTGNYIYNTPVWFLTSLFSACLILWGIDAIKKPPLAKYAIGILFFCASMAFLQTGFLFDQLPFDRYGRSLGAPWNFDLAPLMASFLIAGQAIKIYFFEKQHTHARLILIFLGCLAIFYGAFTSFSPQMDLNYRFIKNYLGVIPCMMAGIGTVLVVASFFSKFETSHVTRYFEFLGKNSLIILIFHAALQAFCLRQLEGQTGLNMAAAILVAFIIASVLALISDKVINQKMWLRNLFYAR